VAPACLEVTTREDDDPRRTWVVTYRVKISGAVRKSVKGPEQVTYELLAPSSDLETFASYSIDQGPPGQASDVSRASLRETAVSLTVERKKDASAVYIREYVPEGDKGYKPQTLELITLKGGPNLFPSFDIPGQFPAIGAYSEASLSRGPQDKPQKIASISACTIR
jgi:hypothetical protein